MTTAGSGTATFAGCQITGTAAAGTYTFKATSGALTANAAGSVTITAGAASQLSFTTPPAGSVGEGAAITTQPVVIAQDANGNAVGGVQVTLAIATYTAGGGGHTQGSISGCTANPVTTLTSGVAIFAGCQITGPAAAGTYTFKATSGALTANAAGSVTITAGAASQMVFTTQPGGSVGEGAAFTQPVLTAEDTNGNTVTGFTSPVTLAIAAYTVGNGGTTQGSISGCTNPVTAVSGLATFAGCTITGPAAAGTYTLNASGGGLTSANSTGSVTITAGAATTLLI